MRVFFLSLILISLTLHLFFSKVKPSFFTDRKAILVKIERGSSARKVAQILAEKRIIHSPSFFLFLLGVSGKLKSLNYGTYLLERNRYWEIICKLDLGLTHRVKVTIPEGWTSYQIAEKLEREGVIIDRESFALYVKTVQQEGFLFPESYFFELMMQPEDLVQAMVYQFNKNYSEEWSRRANELKMTKIQVITLASIIEREAQINSERSLISSVYHNRLKKRMFLEADPTVQYALSQGRSWKSGLTYKDLKIESPYNTYRRTGLPPAPICNPGLKSIFAALYPDKTEFFFFVADGKGGHHFFKTYQKHIQKQLEDRKRGRRKRQ